MVGGDSDLLRSSQQPADADAELSRHFSPFSLENTPLFSGNFPSLDHSPLAESASQMPAGGASVSFQNQLPHEAAHPRHSSSESSSSASPAASEEEQEVDARSQQSIRDPNSRELRIPGRTPQTRAALRDVARGTRVMIMPRRHTDGLSPFSVRIVGRAQNPGQWTSEADPLAPPVQPQRSDHGSNSTVAMRHSCSANTAAANQEVFRRHGTSLQAVPNTSRPLGRAQSDFSSSSLAGSPKHARLQTLLNSANLRLTSGGAAAVPSQPPPASVSSLNLMGVSPSVLRMASIQTRGQMNGWVNEETQESQVHMKGSKQRLIDGLGIAAPTVTHASILAAAGLSYLLQSLHPNSTPTCMVLVAAYIIEVAVLATIACVQVRYSLVQWQVPPLLVTVFHLALWGLEGLYATATWEGWKDASFRVTVLQAGALGLYSGSQAAWLSTWAVLAPCLVLVASFSSHLEPVEVLQVLVLPLLVTAGLSLISGRSSPSGTSWRQVLMEVCLGRLPGWGALNSPADGQPGSKQALKERVLAAIATVEASRLPLAFRQSMQGFLQSLVSEVGALHLEEPALQQQLNLEDAPPAVQEYLMDLLAPHVPQLPIIAEQEDPPPPSCAQSQKSMGELPYTLQVQGLLQPLLAKETAAPSSSAHPELGNEVSQKLGRWDFNLAASDLCRSKCLSIVAQIALRPQVDHFRLEAAQVVDFLRGLETRYHASSAYHNAVHAADVLNSMAYFQNLQSGPMATLRPLERLAGLVAAAAHDVGHDGKNNRFHTVAETALARLYNDQSCLENMHASITFALLASSGTNFLSGMARADWSTFRNMVVHMILETDMSKHFQAVTAFKKEFLEGNTEEDSPKRRQMLLTLVMKASDIGASAKHFSIHAVWATRITVEFFRQGDEERSLGLPMSPLCDRHTKNIGESQVGFFDFIVLPLYKVLNGHLRSRRVKDEVLQEASKNRAFWSQYHSSEFNYEDPEASLPALLQSFTNLVVPFVQGSSSPKG